MQRRTRILILTAAVVILAIAAAWNYKQDYLGERAKVCQAMEELGYSLGFDDWYVTGGTDSTSIAELLEGVPLEDAVEASKQAGFRSDIHQTGKVVVFLAALSEERVLTVYTLDGEAELCFIQHINSYEVEALCQESD